MVPIRFNTDNNVEQVLPNNFSKKIFEICKNHFAEERAYAFAFIFFDFHNPQIAEILSNYNYWKALDVASSNYLSIFHLHSDELTFAEDLDRFNGIETRSMYNIGISQEVERLKYSLTPEEEMKLPSILFFQTDGNKVLDYYIVELQEDKIEESFLEIKSYINEAVKSLIKVTPENRINNKQSVFTLIESSVKANQLKRKFNRTVETFPLNLLLGWIVGKI